MRQGYIPPRAREFPHPHSGVPAPTQPRTDGWHAILTLVDGDAVLIKPEAEGILIRIMEADGSMATAALAPEHVVELRAACVGAVTKHLELAAEEAR